MTERLDLPRRYRDRVEALLREHVPDSGGVGLRQSRQR